MGILVDMHRLPNRVPAAISIATAAILTTALIAGAGTRSHRPVPAPQPVAPATLRETGLYADWATRTIAPDALAFSPQYPLWTDGARKHRWIHLPAGASIDGSRPDAWQFPVGTKVWKEFAFDRRVETRYMELGPAGWVYATYLWTADETEATLAPARGAPTTAEVAPGTHHVAPGEADCVACHGSAPTAVLGFSALQLSPDRDPGALRADASAGAVDLASLIADGRLRGFPGRLAATPPRITARTPTERAALGYLHGNCGHCHNSTGPLAALGMSFFAPVDPADGLAAATRTGTIGHASRFTPAGTPPGAALRIAPGDPAHSVVVARIGSRDPLVQMPPIGTQLVDAAAARLIARWIEQLPVTEPKER